MFHVKHFLLLVFVLAHSTLFGQTFNNAIIEVRELPVLPSKVVQIEKHNLSFGTTKMYSLETAEWLYWINYSRLYPKKFWDSVVSPILKVYPQFNTGYARSLKVDLYNAGALEMFKPDSVLSVMAQNHSLDLSRNNANPSHNSTNGATFQQRMNKYGIVNCAGENISYGNTDVVLALVFLYLDEGIPGLGHRKALLNPDYKLIGLGLSKYRNGNSLIIQDFACLQSPS